VAASAQLPTLRVIVFGGADTWPLYVTKAKGFFEDEGINVSITPTPGSVYQIAHVMSGDFDIVGTAIDNLVAYDEGQGDPSVPGPFDLFAFMGASSGFLRLVVRPEIATYADLRGKKLAVDALSTGFAFVLRRMLDLKGVHADEYTLVPVGATQQRFDAMVAGTAVAAVVTTPFEVLGQEQYGFRLLGSAIDVLKHYQAGVFGARRSWAATHRDAIARYIRAYRTGARWLLEPANRDEAVAILAREAKLAQPLALKAAGLMLSTGSGFSRDGSFDLAGIETVLRLRGTYAAPKVALGDPARYLDPSFGRLAG